MSAAKNKKTAKAKTPSTLPFLVEIGTEELPPKSLRRLAHAFLEHFEAQALAKGLLPAKTHNEVFFSPRRLAIYAPALYPRQPDRSEEKLGPAVAAAYDASGQPTKAAEGFAKSCNTTVDKLSHKQTDKGERLAFTLEIKGETANALLPGMVQEALAKLPIGKRMRWGAGTTEFVRPVHWVLMLLGDKLLKSEILGLSAGDKTYGHRFHHPAAIPVKKAADYRKLLEKTGKVLVEDRDGTLAKRIGALVTQAAAKVKGKVKLEQSLLEEVAALVEWPVPLVGDFDPKFLTLPEEVIDVVLQGQQRYFPLRSSTGKLLPHFVTISNVQSKDPKEVKRGNERVIVPRLTDAMFFWDLDKGARLDTRVEDLETMLFQKELGSYGQKQKRVAKLAEHIARQIGGAPHLARRAAELAKCDLLSNLVGEFPELQGSIGRHVALASNEDAEVARAIEEHYLPRFAGDRLPITKTGQALAIADKLDTICGIFAIEQRPTGEKDPFGLRRQALGAQRIASECELDLDFVSLIGIAIDNLPVQTTANVGIAIFGFMSERLRAYYDERGIDADVFYAAEAIDTRNPLDLQKRVNAVQVFSAMPEAANLIAANKRIANILKQAGQEIELVAPPDAALFTEPTESKLYNALVDLEGKLEPMISNRDYAGALRCLAALKPDIDEFFEKIMVMVDDPKVSGNRLALLGAVRRLFLRIADVSQLQTS